MMSTLRQLPLVAILRGLPPAQAVAVAQQLLAAGFRWLEVPLTDAAALASLQQLRAACLPGLVLGAGTVRSRAQLTALRPLALDYIVSPDCQPGLIAAAKDDGLLVVPGCTTISEAFAALDAGADALKLFPAQQIPPAAVSAMRTVLPADTLLLAVGGISGAQMPAYLAAGCQGFGLGAPLYKPGVSLPELAVNAASLYQAFVSARGGEHQPGQIVA